MKLIAFPLTVLILCTLVSMMGLSTTHISPLYVNEVEGIDSELIAADGDGWYDFTGHKVCDLYETDSGEEGGICLGESGGGNAGKYWLNETNVGVQGWRDKDAIEAAGNALYNYPIVDCKNGTSIAARAEQNYTVNFQVATSYGLIALIIGIMALAAIVGIRVFSTGISESSANTIIKGTAYLSLWAMFSITSLGLITSIPLFGPVIYFALSGIYTLGIMQQIGGGN